MQNATLLKITCRGSPVWHTGDDNCAYWPSEFAGIYAEVQRNFPGEIQGFPYFGSCVHVYIEYPCNNPLVVYM